MELPRARPWMILDRVIRFPAKAHQTEAGHGAGASTSVLVGMIAPGEVEEAIDQVWLEQRVTSLDCYESAAAVDAAQVARAALASDGHHFTVSVKAPPLITFLTTRISYLNPPAKPHGYPYIVATGTFCLLVQFSTRLPRDPDKFYYFNPPAVGHLVVARSFFGGFDGQIGARADLVPDRGDDIPEQLSRNVESVGFLCDDDNGTYIVAELKVATGADTPHNAVLTCYESVLRAWSSSPIGAPLPPEVDGNHRIRPWLPHGAVSLDSTVLWFDLSWGLLSLDFNLQKSEFGLEFCSLPADRDMVSDGPSGADIYDRRCITVSDNLLRYVEIIVGAGEATTVSMWSRRRRTGVNGWEWALDFEESFEHIWNSESYIQTGLPRKTPILAFVNPVESDEVYFTLRQHLFGVNLIERRVVHFETIGSALRNSKDFLTWNLPKRGAEDNGGHAPQVQVTLAEDVSDDEVVQEQDREVQSQTKTTTAWDRRGSKSVTITPMKVRRHSVYDAVPQEP